MFRLILYLLSLYILQQSEVQHIDFQTTERQINLINGNNLFWTLSDNIAKIKRKVLNSVDEKNSTYGEKTQFYMHCC